MSTRMKDSASDLGVSVITISKVLRNHPDVGDKTREPGRGSREKARLST